MDLGTKVPVDRIEHMKKVEKEGKLNKETMLAVVDGKNVLDQPKQEAPEAPRANDPTQGNQSPFPNIKGKCC